MQPPRTRGLICFSLFQLRVRLRGALQAQTGFLHRLGDKALKTCCAQPQRPMAKGGSDSGRRGHGGDVLTAQGNRDDAMFNAQMWTRHEHLAGLFRGLILFEILSRAS